MNEAFNADAMRQIVVNTLSEIGALAGAFIPRMLGTIVILGLGWLVARLVQAAAGRILARAGLDAATTRLGIAQTLERAGIQKPPSGLIAQLLFWVLMLTFVMSAAETLGLTAVTTTIDRLIAYLPNVIAAALLVVMGMLSARFAGSVVSSAAAAGDLAYARPLGTFTRGCMTIVVWILAIEQLGIDATLLLYAVITLLAAVSAGLGLSFALGSRKVMNAILSGYYLRKTISEGMHVTVDGREGVLERIGPTDALFRSSERDDLSWSIPNARLLDEIIERDEQNAA